MKRLLLFIFAISSITVSAQYVTNYKKVADTYFHGQNYYAAAEYYKKALGVTADTGKIVVPYAQNTENKAVKVKIEDNREMIFRLAEASRNYKNFEDAEKYYAIAKEFPEHKYSSAKYWYGHSLKANQRYEAAALAFHDYLKRYPDSELSLSAKEKLASCEFAIEEMKFPRMVKIQKLNQPLNSLGSNYAPVLKGDEFYFTSSRPTTSDGKQTVVGNVDGSDLKKKDTPYLNTIYIAEGNPTGETVNAKLAKLERLKGWEYGASTFNPEGNKMYFTAWQTTTAKKKYSIYYSELNGESWSTPKPLGLEINGAHYDSRQPHVTPDGKTLIFCSDRPGGFGLYDLWFSPIRQDGSFGQAVNMGSKINTKGNEEAPFYNPNTKVLMFSSDGRVGLGGYDFYTSEGNFGDWSEPRNMGYPFNSSKDDGYFTPLNKEGTEGYISSDRESLCCLELFYVKQEFVNIKGQIIDCKTNKPLNGVSISLTSQGGDHHTKTDEAGNYQFKIDNRRGLKLKFDLDGYFSKTKTYSFEEMAKADTLFTENECLTPFKVDQPIVLENIYFEFNSAELNVPSKNTLDQLYNILLDNADIRIELSAHTDSKGAHDYNLTLSDKRANACVNYLIEKGIPSGRMIAKGFGETQPVAPNEFSNGKDNPDGRARNRRTEFKVLK